MIGQSRQVPGNMIKAVLFDLDGTLLDSAPDLVATLNHLRAGLGLAAMPVADLRHFVSRGAPGLIKAGMPPCDDETREVWQAAFIDHYQENNYINSRPFEGVDWLLSQLLEREIPWGIVTNKAQSISTPIMAKTGWLALASAVICGDMVTCAKPHPEPVLAACSAIGVDPANVLMVGDDLRDVEAGRRAGCGTAFALYGYADQKSQFEIGENTALIHAPEDVLDLLPAPVKN
jgi:2-phosphoglycolate phosphatase